MEYYQGSILFLKRRFEISTELLSSSGIDLEALNPPALVVQTHGLPPDR